MKVINRDNFGRDAKSDSLVCENINEYYGKEYVAFLNDKADPQGEDFYALEADNYILHTWEP